MDRPSYNELLQRYKEATQTIIELRDALENKDWKIDLLQTNIQELEEILFETGTFKHFE